MKQAPNSADHAEQNCNEGEEILDDKRFRIGIQGYHFKNMEEILCQMELLVCPEDERWIMMP